MVDKPSAETQARLHLRLLAREPDAPADLVHAFLTPLLEALHGAFPAASLPDPALVDDCVMDTLLNFPKHPEKLDPARGSLWTFLFLDAKRDVLNALDKHQRRSDRERRGLAVVAQDERSRNEEQEGQAFAAIDQDDTPSYLPEGVRLADVRAEVAAILADPTDLAVVTLLTEGVRETRYYAAALSILHLSPEEQRRSVKQIKDRWKKRLSRLGARLNDT